MFRWCALILVILLSLNGPVDARVRTTADAIIIEVDLNDEREARSAKTPSGTYLLTEENSCWTSDGHQGVCSSLRSCYPGYQLPELKNFESLNELSIRGTCSYNKADGSQAYGVCCPRQGFYFSPSFLGNFFGGGNQQFGGGFPQFGGGSFPWLQPAGFPWWGAGGGAGGAGGGFPSFPSYPSIPAAPPAPIAPVDMGPPPTESWESWTPKPTESWESWTEKPTESWESWTEKPTESWESWTEKPTESWESWTEKPTETWEHWTTKPTTSQTWWAPPSTTPSTTTQQSWESWTTTSSTTTTQQPVVTNPPDSGNDKFPLPCGSGPYKVLDYDDEQNRIVGGTTAQKNSWPFMVSMQSNQRHFCGASLINENYVLTAAHCIASFTSADVKKLEVVLAMHKTKGDTSAIRKRVSRLVRHKGYNPRTLYNDIAIMKLDSPATFGPTISAVCLPPSSNTHSERYGKEATVIGWGATRFQGPLPDALQQVTVKVQTNEECKKNYGSDAPGDILASMICAGLPGKDSCQGDSGGPMLMNSAPGSPWTQVGVVSWGIECSKPPYPGVYTSVAHFIEWINKNAT